MGERQLAERAAEMFAVLSDTLRVRILLALAESRRPDWDHRPMSYSDLRKSVGVEDGGRFNYHLDELCGQFVERSDGRYRLTLSGSRLVDEIYAGTFARRHEPRVGELGYDCPGCGREIHASVEDGQILVTCPEHDQLIQMFLPANAVEGRSLEALHELAIRHAQQYRASVCWDVCPHCAGHFDGPEVEHWDRYWGSGIMLGFECRCCGTSFNLPVELFALVQPAVIAFFHDHGIDPTGLELYHGDTEWSRDAHDRGDDFLVYFDVEDDRLEVEMDRSLEIHDVRRTSAPPP